MNKRSATFRGHALFTAVPLVGHLNPLLVQAEELASRGWRVTVVSMEEMRRHVEGRPGVNFIGLAGTMEGSAEQREAFTMGPSFMKTTLWVFRWLCQAGWAVFYDGVLEVLRRDRPDVVVADFATFAGVDAAETVGVSCVVNNPDVLTLLPTRMLPPAHDVPLFLFGQSVHELGRSSRLLQPLRRLFSAWATTLTAGRFLNASRRSRQLPPVDFHRRLSNKLVLVNSAFGLEYSRPLPPLIQLVGPMVAKEEESLPDELSAWLEAGPPVIYVNMGTAAVPSPDFLRKLQSGLHSTEFRVLWVVRPSQQAALSDMPANIRIEPWVSSQLAVLRHSNVRAFVSHCGINSVHESMHAGTPIVGIPLFGDQMDMALRVRDASVGLLLQKHLFTAEDLRSTVLRVSRDSSFLRNIPAIQSSFELAGGVRRAADLIEQAALAGTSHYQAGWGAVPS